MEHCAAAGVPCVGRSARHDKSSTNVTDLGFACGDQWRGGLKGVPGCTVAAAWPYTLGERENEAL
jgi:hypothetical protein